MMSDLLEKLECPYCFSKRLMLVRKNAENIEVRDGQVVCNCCNHTYIIKQGILDMLVHTHETVVKEKEGNLLMVKAERSYLSNDWLLSLPYSHSTIHQAKSVHDELTDFEGLLKALSLPKAATIIDLGAGTCWTTNALSIRGYNPIATDISTERFVGLSSADVFMNHYGTYFERILCDMSDRLPFRDNSIDAVIAMGAIHHAHDIRYTFKEVHRILKPGGKLGIVDVTRSMLMRKEKDDFGQKEKKFYHWNENRYTFFEYQQFALNAGLTFRVVAAPSLLKKMDLIASGEKLPDRNRLKHKIGQILAPLWRFSLFRWFITKPVYPLMNILLGTQFIGVCTKPIVRSWR